MGQLVDEAAIIDKLNQIVEYSQKNNRMLIINLKTRTDLPREYFEAKKLINDGTDVPKRVLKWFDYFKDDQPKIVFFAEFFEGEHLLKQVKMLPMRNLRIYKMDSIKDVYKIQISLNNKEKDQDKES